MEALKKHHLKCKTTYTVKDEKDKPINVDVYNYNVDEFMPFIISTLSDLHDKNIELEKKIISLQKSLPATLGMKCDVTKTEIPEPVLVNENNSRVKKPIFMNF